MKEETKDSRTHMLHVNTRQKDFYESRFEAQYTLQQIAERSANAPTNLWTWMRYQLKKARKSVGVDDYLYTLHKKWMQELDLKQARVLDLGCFAGNPLSLWIAENCADYTGIDLSEQATALLDAKLREHQLTHARAYAQDFLANSYPDNHFDLIYAFSVLHHFKDMSVMLDELYRVLKPGGVIISFDPLKTEPLNRLARTLYRPLQSDRDWEWPFDRKTFHLLQTYFNIEEAQGVFGMMKLGLPFQVVPGLGGIGRAVGRWGMEYDRTHSRGLNLSFFLCWQATLRLRKS